MIVVGERRRSINLLHYYSCNCPSMPMWVLGTPTRHPARLLLRRSSHQPSTELEDPRVLSVK